MPRQRQRDDHAAERADAATAVDHRRLLELLRDAVEEGLHEESGER
jgi:hypothetical protein